MTQTSHPNAALRHWPMQLALAASKGQVFGVLMFRQLAKSSKPK
jgi:hypothetical protein